MINAYVPSGLQVQYRTEQPQPLLTDKTIGMAQFMPSAVPPLAVALSRAEKGQASTLYWKYSDGTTTQHSADLLARATTAFPQLTHNAMIDGVAVVVSGAASASDILNSINPLLGEAKKAVNFSKNFQYASEQTEAVRKRIAQFISQTREIRNSNDGTINAVSADETQIYFEGLAQLLSEIRTNDFLLKENLQSDIQELGRYLQAIIPTGHPKRVLASDFRNFPNY